MALHQLYQLCKLLLLIHYFTSQSLLWCNLLFLFFLFLVSYATTASNYFLYIRLQSTVGHVVHHRPDVKEELVGELEVIQLRVGDEEDELVRTLLGGHRQPPQLLRQLVVVDADELLQLLVDVPQGERHLRRRSRSRFRRLGIEKRSSSSSCCCGGGGGGVLQTGEKTTSYSNGSGAKVFGTKHVRTTVEDCLAGEGIGVSLQLMLLVVVTTWLDDIRYCEERERGD